MIKVRKDYSLFWQFILLATIIELVGFVCRWLFGIMGWFLSSSMWHGWLGASLYCIVWIYAAIVWVVCWVCQYAYIYGAVYLAFFAVLYNASERTRSMKQTFKIIVQYQARKLLKTYEVDRGLGNRELHGFLNVIHAANIVRIRNRDIEDWVGECFAKNSELKRIMKESTLSIKYRKTGKLPDLLVNEVPFLTH